jgi:hypothetical protein
MDCYDDSKDEVKFMQAREIVAGRIAQVHLQFSFILCVVNYCSDCR